MIEITELAVRRVLKNINESSVPGAITITDALLMIANELEALGELDLEYTDCNDPDCPRHSLPNELITLRGRGKI